MALTSLLWTIPLLGCCRVLVSGHAASLCRPNERFLACGSCQKTCRDPEPVCAAVCRTGCYCPDGLVRNDTGDCVHISECLPLSNLLMPAPYQLSCGPHQEYRACQQCERTCSSEQPVCSSNDTCNAGCFCKDGYVKSPSGQCVKPEECPRAEVSHSSEHEVSIEDCAPDEVYLSCGWCEPSCWDPNPECPRGVCTRGCLCRPPLLRHHSGHCVEPGACRPQKCTAPNEEYVCRYGCETRCDGQMCTQRPRKCQLGCHCKLGLLRDSNGKCVSAEKCSNATANLRDITRKGTKSNSTFASSVFGPIKLGKVLSFIKPNISQTDPGQLTLFKSPVFDTKTNPKKFYGYSATSPIPSIIFLEHYTTDPFRFAFDTKIFQSFDVEKRGLGKFSKPSTKPSKKVTVSTKLEQTTDRGGFTKDPVVSKTVVLNHSIPKVTKDSKLLNDTSIAFFSKFVNELMKQMIAPVPSVNYTIANHPKKIG